MRRVRCFSSTCRSTTQQLYTPYVRPLNSEQKKAIHKECLKLNPIYHPHFNRDVEDVLPLLESDHDRIAHRDELLNDVTAIMRRHYGRDIEIMDVSIRRYAMDLHTAPIEIALVDPGRGQGFKNEKVDVLPEVYDPVDVAKTLSKAGFQGIFRGESLVWQDFTNTKKLDHKRPPMKHLISWPQYRPKRMKELVYPATLEVTSPQPFNITLPHPTLLPLMRLLRAYCKESTSIFDLVSIVCHWARSWRLDDFTPVCLTLMVIHCLQCRTRLLNLQKSSTPKVENPPIVLSEDGSFSIPRSGIEEDGYAWIPGEYLREDTTPEARSTSWQRSLFRISLEFGNVALPPLKNNWAGENKLPSLMYKFFSFWVYDGTGAPRCLPDVQSVRDGRPLERPDPVIRPYGWVEPKAFENNKGIITPEYSPTRWWYHALVVQDPFVFTHNHAQTVTQASFREFEARCWHAKEILRRGHRFEHIFGPYRAPAAYTEGKFYDPPDVGPRRRTDLSDLGKRMHHTSSVLHSESRLGLKLADVPPDVIRQREKTRRRVNELIKSKFGKEYSVVPFGSTCYGTDSAKSDLDFVILDPQRPAGLSPHISTNKLPRIYNIRLLHRIFHSAGFRNVSSIPTASVPIVKFIDPETNISCDINVNDRLGITNTALIQCYCELAPPLRLVLFAIKQWAKHLRLNSPADGSFSSYAFANMTIGLFQRWGLLPNLQDSFRDTTVRSSRDGVWFRSKIQTVCCDVRYSLAEDWMPGSSITADQALQDWFHYWGHEHDYQNHVLSIRDGGLAARRNPDPPVLGPTDPVLSLSDGDEPDNSVVSNALPPFADEFKSWTGPLCIADPFIITKNLASNVSWNNLLLFQAECRRAAAMISKGCTFEELVGKRKPQDKPPKHLSKPTPTTRISDTSSSSTGGSPESDPILATLSQSIQRNINLKSSRRRPAQKPGPAGTDRALPPSTGATLKSG